MAKSKIKLEGKTVEAEFLGQGCFAKAYLYEGKVYCFVKDDYSKEAIANLDVKHLPKIEWVETTDTETVYKMPFYQTVTAAHKEAWAILQELIRAENEVKREYSSKHWRTPMRVAMQSNIELSYQIMERAEVPQSVKEALDILIGNISNYGSTFVVEFRKANVAVDETGAIVLRDCAFDQEVLWNKRKR